MDHIFTLDLCFAPLDLLAYSVIIKLVRIGKTDPQIIFLFIVPEVLFEVGGVTIRDWAGGNSIRYPNIDISCYSHCTNHQPHPTW